MTLQELLRGLRVEFLESGHHHARLGWLQVKNCPWCGSDSYHLGYHLQKKFFTCWRCRWHPVIPTLLKLGASQSEAREFYLEVVPRQEVRAVHRNLKLIEPKYAGALKKPHRRYLRDRDFNPAEIAAVWNVGGIGIRSNLKWRLYIPIHLRGEKVSWTTRSICPDARQRYISASAEEEVENHKHLLYGADYCHLSVVVVEGPTDVWAVGPGACGLFGTAFTAEQVVRLADFPYRFVCFDNSQPAQRAARQLCDRLSVYPGRTENIVLTAKDPGSASAEELLELKIHCGL